MKRTTLILLAAACFAFTGCEKGFLSKKDNPKPPTPEEKYYGTTWKATKIAQDLNLNNQADANEMFGFNGTSILQLIGDKKFNYTLTTSSGSTNMNGSWTLSADQKSITINDAAKGTLRFDSKTDTEFQTEAIPLTGGGSAWIFYTKK